MIRDWQVGDRVRISRLHWARSSAVGTIVEFNPERKRSSQHLIAFDKDGIGFTQDSKKHLWIAENFLGRERQGKKTDVAR